jgi:hypothetical protein
VPVLYAQRGDYASNLWKTFRRGMPGSAGWEGSRFHTGGTATRHEAATAAPTGGNERRHPADARDPTSEKPFSARRARALPSRLRTRMSTGSAVVNQTVATRPAHTSYGAKCNDL